MDKIKLGKKIWRFKSFYGDYNLKEIKLYMANHLLMDDSMKEYEAAHNAILAIEKSISTKGTNSMLRIALSTSKEDRVGAQMKLHISRVGMLSAMCTKTEVFHEWAMNTNGVDKDMIDTCLRVLFEKLGSFNEYWDSVPVIKSFKFGKSRFIKPKYKVHEMDKTTLYRETLSYAVLNRAMTQRGNLDDGYFDDINKFVATIVRPAKQVEEMSFNSKAFVSGKELKGLSPSEKLNYYSEKLEKQIEKQTREFEVMPLSVAIGVIVCYFEKKKRFESTMKGFIKEKKPT